MFADHDMNPERIFVYNMVVGENKTVVRNDVSGCRAKRKAGNFVNKNIRQQRACAIGFRQGQVVVIIKFESDFDGNGNFLAVINAVISTDMIVWEAN